PYLDCCKNNASNLFHVDSMHYFYSSPDKGLTIQLLPARFQYRLNTSYPHGWNDGPVIPASGEQAFLTGGIFAQYKFVTLQLQPELVTARANYYDGPGNMGE